jgi:hypothetical protein
VRNQQKARLPHLAFLGVQMPTARVGVLMVQLQVQRTSAASPAQEFRSSFRAVLAGCATALGALSP